MSRDPSVIVRQVVKSVAPRQKYVCPTPASRHEAATGLAALITGDVESARARLSPLGFSVVQDTDPTTGRPYLLACSELATPRAWGLYLLDCSTAPSLSVALPHPRSDEGCEDLGMRLWRAVPGSLLQLATVHRDALAGRADQARDGTSLFHHAWTEVAGPRLMTQIQIHGFSERPPRGPAGWGRWGRRGDVVVSVGSARLTLPALRVAERIEALGRDIRRGWDGTADERLTARTNLQAVDAGRNGWAWINLERGAMVRTTPGLWQAVTDAVAEAHPETYTPVDLGASLGARGTVDVSRGDHFLLRLSSDTALELAGPPTVGQRVLLRAQTSQQPHTLRIDACPAEPDVTAPATITITPGKSWYGDLRREPGGRWTLSQSFQV